MWYSEDVVLFNLFCRCKSSILVLNTPFNQHQYSIWIFYWIRWYSSHTMHLLSQHTLYCCLLPSRGGKKYSNDLPVTAMAFGSLWYGCSSSSLLQTSVMRRQNICIMKFILQMGSVLALRNSFVHMRLNHSLKLASKSYQHIDGSVEINHTANFYKENSQQGHLWSKYKIKCLISG